MRKDISDAIQTAISRLALADFRNDMPSEVLDEVDMLCCEHGDEKTLKTISDIQTQLASNDPNIQQAITSLKQIIGMSDVEIEDDTAEAHLNEDIIGSLPSPHTEESPHRKIPDPTTALIDQPMTSNPPAIPFPPTVRNHGDAVVELEESEKKEFVEDEKPLVKNERSIAQAVLIMTLVALSSTIMIGFGAFTLARMKTERTEASIAEVTHAVQSEPNAISAEATNPPPIRVQLPLIPLPLGQRIDCQQTKAVGDSLLIKTNGELWLVKGTVNSKNVCVFKHGPYANQPVPASCFNVHEADDRICPERKRL